MKDLRGFGSECRGARPFLFFALSRHACATDYGQLAVIVACLPHGTALQFSQGITMRELVVDVRRQVPWWQALAFSCPQSQVDFGNPESQSQSPARTLGTPSYGESLDRSRRTLPKRLVTEGCTRVAPPLAHRLQASKKRI